MKIKWNINELNNAISLHNEGLKFAEIASKLNRTTKSIKEKLNNFGINNNKSIYCERKKCLNCDIVFISLISEKRKFCSQSCSAIFNNKKRPIKEKNKITKKRIRKKENKYYECLNCGKGVHNKYCSSKCQHEYKKNETYKKIENGDTSLYQKQYKLYLIYRFGEKCMKCGWNETNLITKKIPIELEHKDGNSENNKLDNLELLCPNCHSLTPTYKALNIGNGRFSRRERYKNGKSY